MRLQTLVLAILCALAALELIARGPARALRHQGAGDFAAPYAAARAWASGEDPYNQRALAVILRDQGRERDAEGRVLFTASVYPPMTFPIVSPFAWPPWKAARALWTTLLVLAAAGLAWGAARLAGLQDDARLAVIAAVLALAPLHTGISRGQPGIVAIALIAWALVSLDSDTGMRSGVMLGLAAALKPQLAAPFILYLLLTGRRNAFTWCGLVAGSALVAGIGWLAMHDVPWWDGWLRNIRLENHGGEMDPAGALSSQMIDVRPLLHALRIPDPLSGSIVLAVMLGAIAIVLARGATDVLLVTSTVAVWTLLVGYHRFYDGALLALPVAWAIRELARGAARAVPWGVLALTAPFLIPGAWMLQLAAERGVVPGWLATSWFFDVVALRHQIWALFAMHAVLLIALAGRRSGHARPR